MSMKYVTDTTTGTIKVIDIIEDKYIVKIPGVEIPIEMNDQYFKTIKDQYDIVMTNDSQQA